MKSKYFVLFTTLVIPALFAVQSQAQVTSESSGSPNARNYSSAGSKFHARVGPGFSMLRTGNSNNNGDRRNGLFVGVFVDMPVSTNISVLTGLDYAQKGMKSSGSILGANYDTTLNLDYLQVPLVLKLNLPVSDAIVLTANGGGYVGYAVRREATQNITSGVGSGSAAQDVSGSFRQFDAGARFGAGLEFPFSSDMAFLVGADYDLGLVNINENDQTPNTQTRSLMASVGLGVQL